MRDNTLQVEIYITGVRWFKFRLWVGSLFLRLAASVIGCGIEIKGQPQPGPMRPMSEEEFGSGTRRSASFPLLSPVQTRCAQRETEARSPQPSRHYSEIPS